MANEARRRSWWGWGWEDEALDDRQASALAAAMSARFGRDLSAADPPELDSLVLPRPRIGAPATLVSKCSTEPYDRAAHTFGKSYRDVVRCFRGELSRPPDLVAFPESEQDVVDLLDWC